jgi:hypothetical protein
VTTNAAPLPTGVPWCPAQTVEVRPVTASDQRDRADVAAGLTRPRPPQFTHRVLLVTGARASRPTNRHGYGYHAYGDREQPKDMVGAGRIAGDHRLAVEVQQDPGSKHRPHWWVVIRAWGR